MERTKEGAYRLTTKRYIFTIYKAAKGWSANARIRSTDELWFNWAYNFKTLKALTAHCLAVANED